MKNASVSYSRLQNCCSNRLVVHMCLSYLCFDSYHCCTTYHSEFSLSVFYFYTFLTFFVTVLSACLSVLFYGPRCLKLKLMMMITETPRMAQHCGPTAAVGVSRDPTFAHQTPATSPEYNRRVHLSLVCPRRGLVTGGMCPGRGQMSSTGADRTEPAPRPPCQQTHTASSLSRPGGGVTVPCRGVQRL